MMFTHVLSIRWQLPRSEKPTRHAFYSVVTVVYAHSAFSEKLRFLTQCIDFGIDFIRFCHGCSVQFLTLWRSNFLSFFIQAFWMDLSKFFWSSGHPLAPFWPPLASFSLSFASFLLPFWRLSTPFLFLHRVPSAGCWPGPTGYYLQDTIFQIWGSQAHQIQASGHPFL